MAPRYNNLLQADIFSKKKIKGKTKRLQDGLTIQQMTDYTNITSAPAHKHFLRAIKQASMSL